MSTETFADRHQAGAALGRRLASLGLSGSVVMGLPRGGVPVAFEVATVLDAALDVVLARKLGAPQQPELAVGAVGEGGALVLNHEVRDRLGIGEHRLQSIVERERAEIGRRVEMYRPERSPAMVEGAAVVVVDDGIATGATALAAAEVLRARGASKLILGVPVAPRQARERMLSFYDEFVSVYEPDDLGAVGSHYDDFEPTSDAEVRRLLALYASSRLENNED